MSGSGDSMERQFLRLLRHVLAHGALKKSDRTGTGTLSLFGHQMRFDLSARLPLLTTKNIHLRTGRTTQSASWWAMFSPARLRTPRMASTLT